jgi:hypothetical protein
MGFYFFGKTASHQPREASSTSESTPNNNEGCVTLWALPFKAKEGLCKLKLFHHAKI